MALVNRKHVHRTLRRLPLVWVAFLVLILVGSTACSSNRPLDPGVVSATEFRPADNAMQITASVLISPDDTPESAAITDISITPDEVVANPGDAVLFSAQAFGSDGEAMSDVDLVWSIVDPRAGTIDEDGTFHTSTNPGVYNNAVAVTVVVNTPNGIQFMNASASVTVLGDPSQAILTTVSILSENPTVVPNQIYRLRAVGYDENDQLIPGVAFVWQVNDPELGRVNEIGYLTVEGSQGTFSQAITVTGIWDGTRVSAQTDVTIAKSALSDEFISVQILPRTFNLDARGRMQLRAFALNGRGELLSGAELKWTIEDDSAGTIDGNGLFVASDTSGVYTEAIRVEAIIPGEQGVVRSEDFASVVILTVKRSPRLARVSMTPRRLILDPEARTILIAIPVDESGAPATNIAIFWSLNNPAAGEVDEFGSFVATSVPGEYPAALRVTIQQETEDEVVTVTATSDVVVTGTLSELHINPQLGTVEAGKTIHFNVSGLDENGVELPGLVVSWAVTHEGIGIIDSFGNFTAGEITGLFEDSIIAEVIQPNTNR